MSISKYNIAEYKDKDGACQLIAIHQTNSKIIMLIVILIIKLMGREYSVTYGKDI